MTQQWRTLVVDDEAGIRLFLQDILFRGGHHVVTASSGEEALEFLRDTPFDLVFLDLRLGGRVDGLRVLEAAKWRWPETVVIILTAHASLDSALAAIREGVDGYLVKPVGVEQVRQAVKEVQARRGRFARPANAALEPRTLSQAGLSVDLDKHEVTRDGLPLALTPREFRLLVHLMQQSSRVVSPRELVQIVQGYDPESTSEARDIIKWYIHRLRRKVEPDPARPQYILNVRGVGYRFGK